MNIFSRKIVASDLLPERSEIEQRIVIHQNIKRGLLHKLKQLKKKTESTPLP